MSPTTADPSSSGSASKSPDVDASLSSALSNLTVASPTTTSTLSLESLGGRIARGELKKILVLTGAGISVSAGIPDFRTSGSGLYDNLQKYGLPRPTAVFEIDYFRRNPQPFYALAKELYPTGQFRPTPTHFFLRVLEERGLLLRNFTQNIDCLESIAGVSNDKLVQAHGGFQTARCIDCHSVHEEAHVRDAVFADRIARCTASSSCNGLVKPDIVFFGESLPARFASCVKSDFIEADLLIVLGTSLTVQPFASLITRVAPHVPRVLINNEPAGEDDGDDDVDEILSESREYQAARDQLNHLPPGSAQRDRLRASIAAMRAQVVAALARARGGGARGGFNFRSAGTRDLFVQSACDDGVRRLAALIGPEVADRLEQLIAEDRRAAPTAALQEPNEDVKKAQLANAAQTVARTIAAAANTTPADNGEGEAQSATSASAPAAGSAASPSVPSTSTASGAASDSPSSESAAAVAGSSSPPASASPLPPFAVGFDFDHTLGLDHGLEWVAVQQYARDDLGVAACTDAHKVSSEAALKEFRDGIITAPVLLQRIADALDLSPEQRARIDADRWRQVCLSLVEPTTPLPGARELFRFLRAHGVPTAVLTNGWSPLQPAKVARALAEEAPKHVLVSDQLPAAKPDPRAFDALAALPGFVGLPRDRIVFIGDNPVTDISGALSAGMKAVWMDWENHAYPVGQAPPTHTVHTLAQAQEYIESLLHTAKL